MVNLKMLKFYVTVGYVHSFGQVAHRGLCILSIQSHHFPVDQPSGVLIDMCFFIRGVKTKVLTEYGEPTRISLAIKESVSRNRV